jgi:hypothetical protein
MSELDEGRHVRKSMGMARVTMFHLLIPSTHDSAGCRRLVDAISS